MKYFILKNFWIISLLISFILFWCFKDIVVFLTLLSVICFFSFMKCFYKVRFLYIDWILFVIYLIIGILGLLILKIEGLKILIVVLGIWFISSFFFNKRL